jgi:hypothetical protein
MVDFSRMGQVGLADLGLFNNATAITFDPSVSSLLARTGEGALVFTVAVGITVFPGGGSQPWVSTVSQQSDTTTIVYSGPIAPSPPHPRTS